MTLDDELKKIEAKAEQDKVEAIRKHKILAMLGDLPTGFKEPWVHFGKLYGTRGSIWFHPAGYASMDRGVKSPDRRLLAALLERFPPLPKILVREGTTVGTRWSGYREDLAEGATITPIHPVTVRVEHLSGFGWAATFEWNASLGEEIWRFALKVRLYQMLMPSFGRLDAEPTYFGNSTTIASWRSRGGHVGGEFFPVPPAQKIAYGSGGREYPCSFLVYWPEGHELDAPSLIRETPQGS